MPQTYFVIALCIGIYAGGGHLERLAGQRAGLVPAAPARGPRVRGGLGRAAAAAVRATPVPGGWVPAGRGLYDGRAR